MFWLSAASSVPAPSSAWLFPDWVRRPRSVNLSKPRRGQRSACGVYAAVLFFLQLQPLFQLSVADLLLATCWLMGAVLYSQRCPHLSSLCYNLHTVEQVTHSATSEFQGKVWSRIEDVEGFPWVLVGSGSVSFSHTKPSLLEGHSFLKTHDDGDEKPQSGHKYQMQKHKLNRTGLSSGVTLKCCHTGETLNIRP